MRFSKPMMVMLSLLGPVVAEASQQWSSCQTITGVSNYLAYSNQVLLGLSPGIPGCSVSGIPGAVVFTVGANGVTASNINSFLASSLAAYTTGRQAMIYYDNSNATCQGIIIANGGYSGQCP